LEKQINILEVSRQILEKIRKNHFKDKTVWQYIHENEPLKKLLSGKITRLVREVHMNDKVRWRKPLGKHWGLYNYSEETGDYTWRSGVNFLNTGTSYQQYLESVLLDTFNITLPYKRDENGHFDYNSVLETIDVFVYNLRKYSDILLCDGPHKEWIDNTNLTYVGIAERSEKLIYENITDIFSDSVGSEWLTEGGGTPEDFDGVDIKVLFNESVKTIQCKSINFIEEDVNVFRISLTMSYEKYRHINYYAFTQGNNYIVFENDGDYISVVESITGSNVYLFNKKLLVKSTF
jgi:hypothetical protein